MREEKDEKSERGNDGHVMALFENYN